MDYVLTETDNRFFDIIEPLGWGTKTTDYNQVKKQLLKLHRTYVNNEMISTAWLAEHESQLENKLSTAARKDLGQDYCCDSWSDTLAHTVGLGRHEFLKCMYDPERLIRRVEKGDYKESFSYCLPNKDDFENLSQWKHTRTAATYLGEIVAEHMIDNPELSPDCATTVETCIRALATLVQGNVEDFLTTKEDVVKLLTANRNGLGWHYGIDNLYRDVEYYREFFDR